MHGEELDYISQAFESNWMSTAGENIDHIEQLAAEKIGTNYAVGLCNCTSALHLCVKLANEKIYGKPATGIGVLTGKTVFCSDMTFAATLNPVLYEAGSPVFIDSEAESWNMDPAALEKAFDMFPETKIVIYAELYGFPGNAEEIRSICKRHGAILIEDAAEALGATVNGKSCGSFGDYSAISYNGNKIITGSTGGCLLTNDRDDADKARKWSTQSREKAPWYQHREVGYNYRMSNVVAGIIRGQYLHLEEHIAKKKAIYERYKEGLKGLPLTMNPIKENTEPNYWLSAIAVDDDFMCSQFRTDTEASYNKEHGKTCPTEILEAISSINAEARPIWKPMHMQQMCEKYEFVSERGHNIKKTNNGCVGKSVNEDIFDRGCCLPSDIKMTEEQQDTIIEVIRSCFD